MAIVIVPLLLGAVLGIRFRVLVLFPVIGAVVVIALVAILAGANDLAVVAFNAALAAICIQLGYLAGMLVSGFSSGQLVQAKISRSA